jgi:hypothetical protein
MFNKIVWLPTASVLLTFTVAPAFASFDPVGQVPEPTTMTLFALGVGGAFIARKFFGKK